MKVEQWKIGDIKPYENNPRINEDAVEKTAMSIREYGWQQPIVVDHDGVIIVGHTRLKAAKSLGLTECPVLVAEDLSGAQAKAYRTQGFRYYGQRQTVSIAHEPGKA